MRGLTASKNIVAINAMEFINLASVLWVVRAHIDLDVIMQDDACTIVHTTSNSNATVDIIGTLDITDASEIIFILIKY